MEDQKVKSKRPASTNIYVKLIRTTNPDDGNVTETFQPFDVHRVTSLDPENKDEEIYVLHKVKNPKRYLPNGKYDDKPLNPNYPKEYYQRTRTETDCPHCQQKFNHPDVLRNHLKRSKRCMKVREMNELKKQIEELEAKTNTA